MSKKPILGLLGGAVWLALAGCQSNLEAELELATLSAGCRINSDCADGLVCVFERCHQECVTSRDCEDDARCMQTEQQRNACQLSDERACAADGRCPGSQVCGVDGECRDGCVSESDCVAEQVCSGGACADLIELDDAGRLPVEPERPELMAPPCNLSSDCPDALVCRDGECVTECASDRDCGREHSCLGGVCARRQAMPECVRNSDCELDERCADGVCEPSPVAPAPDCRFDSDCTGDGQHCVDGACRCECGSGMDCAYGFTCEAGCACRPSLVVQGDVTIEDDAQARRLEGVVEVTGEISITMSSTIVLRFPHLKSAGSIRAKQASGATPTVVFDALERVRDVFFCEQQCVAPKLELAGTVTAYSTYARELHLPLLREATMIDVWGSPMMHSLRLPALTRADTFRVSDNYSLALIEAPNLKAVETLLVNANVSLPELSLPLAQPTARAEINFNAALAVLDLPSLTALSGPLAITGSAELRDLDLSRLERSESVLLNELPKLARLRLNNLANVAGNVVLEDTSLTELDSLNWKKDGRLTQLAALVVNDNALLSECKIMELYAALEEHETELYLEQAGNLACGAACEAGVCQ